MWRHWFMVSVKFQVISFQATISYWNKSQNQPVNEWNWNLICCSQTNTLTFSTSEKKKKKLKKSFIQMTRCLSKQTANSVATVASRQLIRVFAFGKRDATYSSLQLRENASLIKNEINKWGKKKKRKKSFTLGNPRQSLTTSGINDEKKPLLADCVWFYHETTRTCTSAGRAHSRADMNEFA